MAFVRRWKHYAKHEPTKRYPSNDRAVPNDDDRGGTPVQRKQPHPPPDQPRPPDGGEA